MYASGSEKLSEVIVVLISSGFIVVVFPRGKSSEVMVFVVSPDRHVEEAARDPSCVCGLSGYCIVLFAQSSVRAGEVLGGHGVCSYPRIRRDKATPRAKVSKYLRA